MNDLISRRAAIDALKEHRALYCDNTPDTFSKLSYADKSRVDELDTAIATLVNLPSAQPERKVGHWVPIDDEPHEDYECDVCGYISEATFGPGGVSGNLYNYCPNCGARMESE